MVVFTRVVSQNMYVRYHLRHLVASSLETLVVTDGIMILLYPVKNKMTLNISYLRVLSAVIYISIG